MADTSIITCAHCSAPIDLREGTFVWVHTDTGISACAPPHREFRGSPYAL